VNPLRPLGVELDGTHLIEASAGTGKTYTITTLYLRLVIESGLEVSQILVVTYTKAATAELRQRVRDRCSEALGRLDALLHGRADAERKRDDLDELIERVVAEGDPELASSRLQRAVASFDEASIFTIHGFCQRVLQDNAFESGVPFESELVTDPRPLLREVAEDFWTRELYAAPPVLVRHLQERKLARREYSPELLASLASKAVTHPDLRLLPDRAPVDLDAPAGAWDRAYARASDLWSEAQDAVLALLTAGDRLKATSYKPETIRTKWVPQLSQLFESGQPGHPSGLKFFANLTPSILTLRTKKGQTPPEHAFFDACESLRAADEAYVDSLEQAVLALLLDVASFARDELDRRKLEDGTQTFDDLLQRLGRALEGSAREALAERVRGQYRAALIDEFQDTDPLQYRIFRTIWHEGGLPLFLIGDPKQAIYAFRGADVFAYMDACEDAGDDRRHTLTTNWRSDPSLIAGVNAIFEGSGNPFVFDRIPFDPARPSEEAQDLLEGDESAPVRLLFVSGAAWGSETTNDSRKAIDAAVAADVQRLTAGGTRIDGEAVEPGDVAILCRTNAQAKRMQEALRGLGIASVVQGDQSVFESVEAEELERVLRAVAEPSNLRALRAAITTSILGVSGSELHALEASDQGLDTWLERFQAWHDCWLAEGTIALLHRLFDDHEAQSRLLSHTDGERRLTNLLHLAELLQATALQAGVGPVGLVAWLGRMRADLEARQTAGDAAQMRLESDARAVQLVTIHKSKGLEYPVVYCPGSWDGALMRDLEKKWVEFHDPEAGNALTLDIGSEGRDANLGLAEREKLAETLRLLYVALTRAKRQLVLVWAVTKDSPESALGYLLHGPESLVADGAERPEALVGELRKAFGALEEDALRADLERLAQASGGSVSVSDLVLGAAPGRDAEREPAPELEPRRFGRRFAAEWRTSSFSGLVAGAAPHRAGAPAPPSAEGYDYDVPLPRESPPLEELSEGRQVRLHDFPAGTGPGIMIHDVYEHLDFSTADEATIAEDVRRSAERHGIDPRFLDPLCRAIREQLDTPLGGAAGSLPLSEIARNRRLDELEFIFPVSLEGRPRLTPARLARVFREHASDPRVLSYAERLAGLSFRPLEGHLRGFIDLVFEHDGRFYVVDYKSNRLGAAVEAYAPAQLDEPMAAHDYLLQYHVYAVALHRHLARHLPGYDYDAHMGGVYYLFLRGMAPDHPPGSGIYHDRPPRALVEALSELFAEGGSA